MTKMTKIEQQHKAQFDFIKKHGIKVGSKVKVDSCPTDMSIREITWINPHWGWFGDKSGQIELDSIIKVI